MNYNAKPFKYIRGNNGYTGFYPRKFNWTQVNEFKKSAFYHKRQMIPSQISKTEISTDFMSIQKIFQNQDTGQKVIFLPTARNVPKGYESNVEIEKSIKFVKIEEQKK
jgi:hypothetical protein